MAQMLKVGGSVGQVNYCCPKEVENAVRLDPETQNDVRHCLGDSDLVSGTYEGGLKLWECAIDLSTFLASKDCPSTSSRNVLEIGCGFGVPGIVSLLRNKNCLVCFQDFNVETLKFATAANVRLNFPVSSDETVNGRVTFESGDWIDVAHRFKNDGRAHTFDLILTSETIYNVAYYERLHDLLDVALTPSGRILLAAKQIYFGLSGSVAAWLDFVQSKQKFKCETLRTSPSSVPRLIVEMIRLT